MYLFDLIGVFAFAFFGASSALAVRLHYGVVALCAFLTALGGGTIRQIILHRPPAYLQDPMYLFLVVTAILFAIEMHHQFEHLKPRMLILDAVGLIAFAYIGTQAAIQANLGLDVAIGFAILTALGGGVLSDIIIRQKPQVLQNKHDIIPIALVAVLIWTLHDHMQSFVTVGSILAIAFGIRLLLLKWTSANQSFARSWQFYSGQK